MFKGSVKKRSVLLVVLVAIVLVGSVAVLSNGFINNDVNSWVRERNPDNLLDYKMPVAEKRHDTLLTSIDEQGVIRISGVLEERLTSSGNPKYIQWSYSLGKMLLPAGQYTLSCEGGKNGHVILCGQYKDASGKTIDWTGYSVQSTLIFTEPTEVTFTIRILKAGIVNYELYPVINKGANPVDFFVLKTIGN